MSHIHTSNAVHPLTHIDTSNTVHPMTYVHTRNTVHPLLKVSKCFDLNIPFQYEFNVNFI